MKTYEAYIYIDRSVIAHKIAVNATTLNEASALACVRIRKVLDLDDGRKVRLARIREITTEEKIAFVSDYVRQAAMSLQGLLDQSGAK